jgi:hypothetical protein
MDEQVTARPWPAVLEVAAADQQHEQAGRDKRGRPAELASLATDGGCDRCPGDWNGSQDGQHGQDQQPGGHQRHGPRDAAVRRYRPLEADR